ncbi:MAG: glycosyltransferase family 4 protein [Arcanobacterium sp.]|nr:glycosyltransferase family 4 protein [Arcanobacterium sp.]
MKIGIVCGYDWDIPGGVQYHIRDLAQELISRGHSVSVLAPSLQQIGDGNLEPFIVPAGKSIPIPYNGSTARLAFGPKQWFAVRKWLKEGNFDVVHIHEAFTPSVSMLALWAAKTPIVGTFHAATDKSRVMALAGPLLRRMLRKINRRIAVSAEAERTALQYLGGKYRIIPNGVNISAMQCAETDSRFSGTADMPTFAFLGRIDEPRKGLPVVAKAWTKILHTYPKAKLIVAGRGDISKARDLFGENADSVEFIGGISEADKPKLLGSVDIYLAPNTGGESFGIILVEAMAAGAKILASDIPAFRAVLNEGEFGMHFQNQNPDSLAQQTIALLKDPGKQEVLARKAREAAWTFDWSKVATEIYQEYQAATGFTD